MNPAVKWCWPLIWLLSFWKTKQKGNPGALLLVSKRVFEYILSSGNHAGWWWIPRENIAPYTQWKVWRSNCLESTKSKSFASFKFGFLGDGGARVGWGDLCEGQTQEEEFRREHLGNGDSVGCFVICVKGTLSVHTLPRNHTPSHFAVSGDPLILAPIYQASWFPSLLSHQKLCNQYPQGARKLVIKTFPNQKFFSSQEVL